MIFTLYKTLPNSIHVPNFDISRRGFPVRTSTCSRGQITAKRAIVEVAGFRIAKRLLLGVTPVSVVRRQSHSPVRVPTLPSTICQAISAFPAGRKHDTPVLSATARHCPLIENIPTM